MWNRSSTYQTCYSKFRRKKRKSRIKSKKLPTGRSTLVKISLRFEFIWIIWFFWSSYRNCKNYTFPWKPILTDIFYWVWRNIFCKLFSRSFFLRPRRKYIGKKKKIRRNSVNENSIKVRRNTSPHERWKNYAKLRQSQTYAKSAKMKYPILKFQSINTGKDFKISKKRV